MDRNIRQSSEWKQFFEFIGWKCITTSSGINVFFYKFLNSHLVKVQRPHVLTKKDIEEIETIAAKKGAVLIKIEPEVGQDEKLLTDMGYLPNNFPLSPPSSAIMDLHKSEEELWENISHSGKYSINRSKREGDTVSFINNPDEAATKQLYEAMHWTGKTKKYYVEPFSHVLKRTQIYNKNAYMAQVYNKDGQYLGGATYLVNGKSLTFIYGSMNEFGRKGKAGYQLLWQAILYFKKLGFDYLDLEGVDDKRFAAHTKSWGGFSHFKEKFNGAVVVYPVPYMKVLSKVLKFIGKFQPLPF